MKRCTKCGELRNSNQFMPMGYVRNECRLCINARSKQWRENSKKNQKQYNILKKRHNKLAKKNYHKYKNAPSRKHKLIIKKLWGAYKITETEIQNKLNDQMGCCPICGKDFTEVKMRQNKYLFYVIDHDHATGKIRGLLCSPCNLALGHYEKHLRGNMVNVEKYLKK